LLTATSAFELGTRRRSSAQRCYMHATVSVPRRTVYTNHVKIHGQFREKSYRSDPAATAPDSPYRTH